MVSDIELALIRAGGDRATWHDGESRSAGDVGYLGTGLGGYFADHPHERRTQFVATNSFYSLAELVAPCLDDDNGNFDSQARDDLETIYVVDGFIAAIGFLNGLIPGDDCEVGVNEGGRRFPWGAVKQVLYGHSTSGPVYDAVVSTYMRLANFALVVERPVPTDYDVPDLPPSIELEIELSDPDRLDGFLAEVMSVGRLQIVSDEPEGG